MFTGIITDVGELLAREEGRLTVRSRYPAASVAVGASIACDGVCLTATSVRPQMAAASLAPTYLTRP